MIAKLLISTNIQKILEYFLLRQGEECYEREVAKEAKISYGSANSGLRKLHKCGVLNRVQKGRMCYYSLKPSSPYLKEFKTLVNLLSLEPIVEKLKNISRKIVLYGSWAVGTDGKDSDIDLFIVTSEKQKAAKIIEKYSESDTVSGKKIQAVIYEPVDMFNIEDREKVFMKEVIKGKVLWEKELNEDNL